MKIKRIHCKKSKIEQKKLTRNKSKIQDFVKKIVFEIVSGVLVAVAVFGANYLYDTVNTNSIQKENLSKIYISNSKEYVDWKFGVPYVSVSENSGLISDFYVLDDIILRTVLDDNSVVAFFITQTKENHNLKVNSTEDVVLGKTTYAGLTLPNANIDSNISMDSTILYYSETQGTGRYGMYNNYVYGNLSYGFYDDAVNDLICKQLDRTNNDDTVFSLREKAKPNTFGIIRDGYNEKISIIPQNDNWSNIFHILVQGQ